jgi:hypothetical protein
MVLIGFGPRPWPSTGLRPVLSDPLVADGAEVVRRSLHTHKSRQRDEHHDDCRG